MSADFTKPATIDYEEIDKTEPVGKMFKGSAEIKRYLELKSCEQANPKTKKESRSKRI